MAKYAVISEEGSPEDGRFEVIILRHTAKWRVLAFALRAAIRGLGPQPTARHYGFRTVDPMPVQIDGEVSGFAAGVSVTVEIAPKALATIS
jgi:diacylglycerol kinase (ATP)